MTTSPPPTLYDLVRSITNAQGFWHTLNHLLKSLREHDIHEFLNHDFEPFEPSGTDDDRSYRDDFTCLHNKFTELNELLGQLWNICHEPGRKLLHGDLLSRAEYHMLQSGATGYVPADLFPPLTKAIGRDWYDEYDVYCLLYYDDGAHRGYIYPDAYYATLRANWSSDPVHPVKPEEVRKSELTPEQRTFWELEYSDEFQRFRE